MTPDVESVWTRRARPLLGTLVEVGIQGDLPVGAQAALAAVQAVHQWMSAHDPDSDIGRFNRSDEGRAMPVHPWTAAVLRLAQELHEYSEGVFDVAQGSGAWRLDPSDDGHQLIRLDRTTRLDLGGLAKGWAVDCAVAALSSAGGAAFWVNAGGDLRSQGIAVPVWLRDERTGGTRPWITVCDGAVATSHFARDARSALHGRAGATHVSVAAPQCAWADGLTKVLAVLGSPEHPLMRDLLRHYQAQAWIHQEV